MISKEAQAEHAEHLANRSMQVIDRWEELADDMESLVKDIRNFAAYVPDDALDECLVSLANSIEEIAKKF
ncbi:MAG: hypothetical protein MN733_08910 [Nitrososphaera sp.]|nr:hypothetical protein [Nitrososphaera sp.]